ncbi:MAG TPA: hypothetical protein VM581_04410 [Magnetospirillaceae bacterium]|nr:hypothetical protein [Magnetospirillaceae bacterium]
MSEAGKHPSSPTTEVHHSSEFEVDGRLKIVIAGLDKNVRDQAVEAANAALNERIAGDGTGGGFKAYLKHIGTLKFREAGQDVRAMTRRAWYGNIGREHYLTKYQKQAERRITESGDVYVHNDIDDDYKVHTTMRFAQEYDEMIHREAGERRTKLDFETRADGSRDEEGHRLKNELHSLLKDAASGMFDDASGNFDEDAFNEEKKRVITAAVQSGLTKDHVGPSLLYADNLMQIALHVRGAAESRRAKGEDLDVDEMLENADIVLGEAKTGARTEIRERRVEKIANKLARIPWVNEGTLASAVSLAYSAGGWAVKYGFGKMVASIAVPGISGGLWAGLRERTRLTEERVQHAREKATGQLEGMELTDRREKLDATVYGTRSANELKDQIGILYDDEGKLRIDSPERLQEAMFMIAETGARIHLSDSRKIDLISFSEVAKVEKERFELDLALAKSKVDLRRFLNNASDDELRALGLSDDTITHMRDPANDALDMFLGPMTEGTQGLYGRTIENLEHGEEGTEARDRLFRKLRRKEVGKAFFKGTLIGAAIGLFAQEGIGTAQAVVGNNTTSLFVENAGATKETWLHGLLLHDSNNEHILPADAKSTYQVNPETKIVMPEGFEVKPSPDGTEASITGHGVTVDNLKLTSEGTLTDQSLNDLKAAGFRIDAIDPTQTSHDVITEAKGQSAQDVVGHHANEAVHVKRDYWYDNDTTNIFEKNEQGLWNPYKQADGSIRITVGGMTDNGSYHDGVHAHWRELAAKGDLQIALSMSKGTQSEVFIFDIDEKGNAIIPPDHFLANMFSKQGDSWRFDGKYTEVVQIHGVDEQGITHMSPLATDVGKGKTAFTDHVLTQEITKSTTYTISFAEQLDGTDILVPPTIPIYGRGGLEPIPRQRNERIEDPYGAPYGYEAAQGLVAKWLRNLSPRLRSNPEAKLNVVDELRWYFGRHSAGYRGELARRIGRNPNLAAMNPDTKLMINIPVAGAFESGNIYRTLSLYKDQDPTALDQTQFVLSVNWKEGADTSKVQDTIAEIERARRDFPQLQISYFTEIWQQEFVDARGGAIYGTVIKSLYDTSLWAIAATNNRTGGTTDPLVVTNDADAKAISRNYLRQLIRSREGNPDADVLMGKIHWGSESFKDYPGYGVVSSFFMLLEDRVRDMHQTIAPASWGPNSAFAASSMAAVGGVNGDMGAGADSELGKRIIAARRPASAIQATGVNSYGGVPLKIAGGVVADAAKGAWVDSSPERLLSIYKTSAAPLTSAWNSFNTGGYTPRPDLKTGEAEDVARDFAAIKQRIEFQFSGILSSSWSIVQDQNVIDAALENIFFKPSGTDLWKISGDRYSRKFEFTPEGETELRAVLDTIHTSVQEGLEMIDDMHEKAAAAAPLTPSTTPRTPERPVAKILLTEAQASNAMTRIEGDPGISTVEAHITVEGHEFNGPMVFERIDPTHGDYVFMPEGNRSGDTWFALSRNEIVRLLRSGDVRFVR